MDLKFVDFLGVELCWGGSELAAPGSVAVAVSVGVRYQVKVDHDR